MENIYTVGKWFQEFEKRNECCHGITGIYDNNKNLETRIYPHTVYDAMSVLLSYLEELDFADPSAHLPRIPTRPVPGLPVQIFSLLGYLVTSLLRPSPRMLRMKATGWPREPVNVEKARIAWRVIGEEQSRLITEYTKAHKININSYMLSKLIINLGPIWVNEKRKIAVAIPVSLHNDISVCAGPTNRFSLIDIQVDELTKPEAIGKQIDGRLKRNDHFSNWCCYNGPRYLGTWLYDFVNSMMGHARSGKIMFSNLGSWSVTSSNAVFMIAPAFHFIPVSVTIMSWGKKFSLAIQIHPHVDLNADELENIMDRWSSDLIESGDIRYWSSSRTVGKLNFIKMHSA